MRYPNLVASVLALAAVALPARGAFVAVTTGVSNPTSLTLGGYTQNFDSLPAATGSGASLGASPGGGWYPPGDATNATLNQPRLAGWDIWHDVSQATEGGQTGHDRLRAASTPSNTGSFYSYGLSATAGSNRALGAEPSASVTNSTDNPAGMFMGVTLKNTTGSSITSLDVSYLGEIWRSGGANTASQNSLTFGYKVGATTVEDTDFTAVPGLKFNSPVNSAAATPLDGTNPANQTAISGTVDLSATPLADGASITLRWMAPALAAASADGLAIDNLSITPSVPEPASIGLLALGGLLLARRKH